MAHNRSYFYVGGHYIKEGQDMSFIGQVYVEKLTPARELLKRPPVIFLHGAGQTGTVSRPCMTSRFALFLSCAGFVDPSLLWSELFEHTHGRIGWASVLLSKGYTVYLVDGVCRGRSPYNSTFGPTVTFPPSLVEARWTGCRHHGDWAEAKLHTQWPGSGAIGDPIFESFYAGLVPSLKDFGLEQRLMKDTGTSLLDRIGEPVILIAHSQGCTHSWIWADVRPALVKRIVALEPSGPPFQNALSKAAKCKPFGITDVPLTYNPAPNADAEQPLDTQEHKERESGRTYKLQKEPSRVLVNMRQTPLLMVTAEASTHAAYDSFTTEFLRQAGVTVQHMMLANHGVHGNGHFMFLEKNNLEILELVEKWMDR